MNVEKESSSLLISFIGPLLHGRKANIVDSEIDGGNDSPNNH